MLGAGQKLHYVILTLYCTCIKWYGTCKTFAWYTLGGTVCMVILKLLVVKWLGLSVTVRVRVRVRAGDREWT